MFRNVMNLNENAPANFPNENTFQPGPNPAPGLRTDATMNPARLHAPGPGTRRWWRRLDAANTDIQRVPGATVPVPVKPLPEQPIYVYAGISYLAPAYQFQSGWRQAFVPEAERRANLHAHTPLLQLSQPIKSIGGTKTATVDSTKRKNYRFKAPKAVKHVG